MSLESPRAGDRPTRVSRVAEHEVRQRLEHERSSRIAQLTSIEATEGAATDELARAQKASIERVLKDIDVAFARLADGSYGSCQECGKAVPAERLEILPYARCCVPCQQRNA
jgi:RNA polymerase-binding transcription factor DksA